MSQVHFSPGPSCQEAILGALNSAENYVDICVFTISDNELAAAILRCYKRGVDIRIITDDDKMKDRGSDIHEFIREGLSVRTDQNPSHMHHKFAIVDGHTLLTGSYNWTRSAHTRNFENLLVTYEQDALLQYADEFERLWEEIDPR